MPLGTTHRKVIEYISDTRKAEQGIKRLEALNQRLIATYGKDAPKAVQALGGAIAKVKTQTIVDERGIKRTVPVVNQLSQSFTTASGQAKTFTETQRVMKDGSIKTTHSLSNMSKSALTLGQNIANLARRAALTIPIWLALRSAVTGTIQAFRNSTQAIIEEDRALQKARRNLTASAQNAQELESQFNQLRNEARKLAIDSGESMDKVVDAFQKFATVGFDYETAMTGATGATKLAVTLFGDSVETAEAFARSLRVLVDESLSSEEQAKQMAEAFALTDQLWKTNAFEVEEFRGNLRKFASTAKASNLSIQETITLLATLSTAGLDQRAGRLLRTTILKSLQNFELVSRTLKLDVNPAVDTTFDYITKLIDALGELSKGQNVPTELAEVVGDLFTVRTTEVLAALKAMRTTLKENAEILPDIKEFDKEYEKQTEQLHRQVKIYHTINQEIGKAFVSGLVDAENFDEALLIINKNLSEMIDLAKQIGTTLSFPYRKAADFGRALGVILDTEAQKVPKKIVQNIEKAWKLALEHLLTKEELNTLLQNLLKVQTLELDIGIGDERLAERIKFLRAEILDPVRGEFKLKEKQLDQADALADKEEKIANIYLKKTDYAKLENQLKTELKAKGLTELETEQAILAIREASSTYLSNDIRLQSQLVEHLKRMEQIELERARARGLISNQVEVLKLQGATTLQVLKAQHALERMYGINQDRMSLLQNELSLQRAITEERLNQNKLSTDTMKLFEIAQKYGRGTAFDISRFLRGEVPLEAFETGGKFSSLMDILEKYFQSEVQQRQAMEYFFRGRGTGIPIAERAAMEGFRPLPLEAIQLPEISTQINEIKVEVKEALARGQLSRQVVEEIVKAIRDNDIVRRAIDEKIEEY
jgi:hypothetical protein